MDAIEKLVKLFQEFPGIGPRQARRFVSALLEKNGNFINDLSLGILNLKKNVAKCALCFRAFENLNGAKNTTCSLCEHPNRENRILVVEREADLENIEKSKHYNGKYFVLGGALSPLRPETQKTVRFRELFERIKSDKNIQEAIIATSSTREGEATALYIEKILSPFINKRNLKTSRLGRGISTGMEIEYSDAETIKSALENRK